VHRLHDTSHPFRQRLRAIEFHKDRVSCQRSGHSWGRNYSLGITLGKMRRFWIRCRSSILRSGTVEAHLFVENRRIRFAVGQHARPGSFVPA
jgi:hypothetical protein